MNRPIRSLVVLLALGAAVTLALLPAGHVRQNQHGLVASLVGPDVALARIRFTAISIPFTALVLGGTQGQWAVVDGQIDCDPGERFRIRVTVTQPATDELDGAVAEGTTQDFCTGEVQFWTVKATTRGATLLEPGAAQACVLATTQDKGGILDAFQSCEEVLLSD